MSRHAYCTLVIERYSAESVGKWLTGHEVRLGGGVRKSTGKPIWTHKQMTDWLGEQGLVVGAAAYRAWVTGGVRPGYEMIAKLASVLGDWPEPDKPKEAEATSSDGDVASAIREQTKVLLAAIEMRDQEIRQRDAVIDSLIATNAALVARLEASPAPAPAATVLPLEAWQEIGRMLGQSLGPAIAQGLRLAQGGNAA